MKRTDVSVTKEEEEEEKVSQQLWCAMYGMAVEKRNELRTSNSQREKNKKENLILQLKSAHMRKKILFREKGMSFQDLLG